MATHIIYNPDHTINNVQRDVYRVYRQRRGLRPELVKSFDTFAEAADYIEWQRDIYADPHQVDFDADEVEMLRDDDAEECEFSFRTDKFYVVADPVEVDEEDWNDYLPEGLAQEEPSCEPFDPNTTYPALSCDEQGNNKWVEYYNGSDLIGLSYLKDFADMDENFKEQILDNTHVYDRDYIIAGQVWVNADSTLFAILYE